MKRKSGSSVIGVASGKRARYAARADAQSAAPGAGVCASACSVTRARSCTGWPAASAAVTSSDTRGSAAMWPVCAASPLTCSTSRPAVASTANGTIDTNGAPAASSVPSAAWRRSCSSVRKAWPRRGRCGVGIDAIKEKSGPSACQTSASSYQHHSTERPRSRPQQERRGRGLPGRPRCPPWGKTPQAAQGVTSPCRAQTPVPAPATG